MDGRETGGKRFPSCAPRPPSTRSEVGAKLRDMMPWIKAHRVVDKTKN